MENDVLISEENMCDLRDQDLAGMEATLKALDLELTTDTAPEPLKLNISSKLCNCGSIVQESPKGEYRCSQCGRIKYEGVKK